MDHRETIKKVFDHLEKQGERSVHHVRGTDLYRGPEGKKCAMGVLIPDEVYDPLMENISIDGLVKGFPAVSEALSIEDVDDLVLLQELQAIHDSPIYWDSGFGRSRAEEYLRELGYDLSNYDSSNGQ